jgi:hypothetical protein
MVSAVYQRYSKEGLVLGRVEAESRASTELANTSNACGVKAVRREETGRQLLSTLSPKYSVTLALRSSGNLQDIQLERS